MTNQRQRTRLLEEAMAEAIDTWAASAADLIGNRMMLDLIERQQRRHLETLAGFERQRAAREQR